MANPNGKGGFRKGQSGNPGGRPAVSGELRALARERTATAIEVLAKIMENAKSPPAARVSACRELLDRGYGRPESALNAKIETQAAPELDFSRLTPEEREKLEELHAAIMPLVAKAQGRSPVDDPLN